jgi:hypothetical protein
MLREFPADLHVHSALSPCAADEMTPEALVRRARSQGVALLAVTDHNSAANVAAVMAAAHARQVAVVPGVELQTREDVHLLCLFGELETVLDWQDAIYRALPARKNREELFGPQWLYDVAGRLIGKLDRLLLAATSFSVEQAVAEVRAREGVVIPSHVDRPAYSLLGHLGFLPPELGVEACEVSRRADPAEVRQRFPSLKHVELVSFSDAHRLDEIDRPRTVFLLEQPSLAEIKKALEGRDGRRVTVRGLPVN